MSATKADFSQATRDYLPLTVILWAHWCGVGPEETQHARCSASCASMSSLRGLKSPYALRHIRQSAARFNGTHVSAGAFDFSNPSMIASSFGEEL